MSSNLLTAANKFVLNNRFGRAGQFVQLGNLIDNKVSAADAGTYIITGGFLTDSTHGTPVATYGSGFTVTAHSTQDGVYILTLSDSDLLGKDCVGIVGAVGQGVDYNGGDPTVTGAGPLAVIDCVCIHMGFGKFWIRIVDNVTFLPKHLASALVTFTILIK